MSTLLKKKVLWGGIENLEVLGGEIWNRKVLTNEYKFLRVQSGCGSTQEL